MRPLLLAALAAFGTQAACAGEREDLRADGSAILFSLELPDAPLGTAVLIQGSGCDPVEASAGIAAIRDAFAGFAALSVEKPGVARGWRSDPEAFNADCPEAFHARNTLAQRIEDHAQVIDALGEELPRPLVLIGGSEGGLVAAALAGPFADAAVLISTGGGIRFGEMIRMEVPEPAREMFDAQLAAVLADPHGSGLWAGYRALFWADIVDRRAVEDMLAADAAFLLIQGGRDAAGVVAAARASADAFAEAGADNLTYWEFPGLDHGLADAEGGSRMGEIARMAAEWVRREL